MTGYSDVHLVTASGPYPRGYSGNRDSGEIQDGKIPSKVNTAQCDIEQAWLPRDRHAVRETLRGCVEVIDWHQEEGDPTRGTVEMMLFEQQLVTEKGVGGAKETPNGQLVTSLCVERDDRLPREDSNLGQSG